MVIESSLNERADQRKLVAFGRSTVSAVETSNDKQVEDSHETGSTNRCHLVDANDHEEHKAGQHHTSDG